MPKRKHENDTEHQETDWEARVRINFPKRHVNGALLKELNLFKSSLSNQSIQKRPISRSSSLAFEMHLAKIRLENSEMKNVAIEDNPISRPVLRTLPKSSALLIVANLNSLLEKIPSSILFYAIWSFLDDLSSEVIFSRTSRRLHSLFQDSLNNNKNSLHHMVLEGNSIEAKSMIEARPELLRIRRIAIDRNGRKYYATPLQLAMATLSVVTPFRYMTMVELIIPFMVQLPDGDKEIDRQLMEWFPEGCQNMCVKDENLYCYFNTLKDKVNQVDDNSSYEEYEDACKSELSDFKNYLETKAKSTIIKSGLCFDPEFARTVELTCSSPIKNPEKHAFWMDVLNIHIDYLPKHIADRFEIRLITVKFERLKRYILERFKSLGHKKSSFQP